MLPVNTQNALGIDIGSTTTKIVLVRSGQIVYEKYERHLSRVREKTLELIEEIRALDVMAMSPIDAMNSLFKIVEKARRI